jgi:hypothetical protein
MTRDEFFDAVERILGTMSPGRTLGRENWSTGEGYLGGKGRWHRGAGIGRFPNRGIVRYYSPISVHVMLHTPALNRTFSDPAVALREINICELARLGQETGT